MSLTATELERLKSILIHKVHHIKRVLQVTEKLIAVSDVKQREELWKEVEDMSAILERVRMEFVNEVLVFMARRQPLGRELLTAHILISIAYDVYRISRYCREIARIDSMLASSSSGLSTVANLSEAFKEAVKAIEAALSDLVEFSPRRTNIVKEIDTRIDDVYKSVLLEITSSTTVSRDMAVKALIMRHIERMVDHAQYIEQYLSELI
uniref:PhoU domain-containing protein n=1 Tax=Ignisphaera aggregans TaxID=334771 RepID=A0A7J3Z909_9CREN